MTYEIYELNHAALTPLRAVADATRLYFRNPLNPFAHTAIGKSLAAAAEVFERSTRRYGKPEFGLASTWVRGETVPITEVAVWERPFCRLVHFERGGGKPNRDPKLLIVAPMSGHYATLLRGTVEAMLPRQDVYITDWTDARMVPLAAGRFDLDSYIDYVIEMIRFLGPNTHVLAVCQPAVPVFAAAALMEEDDDPAIPASITLMGGPIDTRVNRTEVNKVAEQRGIDWFRRNVIMTVPFPHPGFMRPVYPGFLQLGGFMSMNLDRHITAHRAFYNHLIQGDGDSARKHTEFYDEYLAVMDLTAEFYLQTCETVFIRHDLPQGRMYHRERLIDPKALRKVAMMTVEGEKDDISGVGQTAAAHALAPNIPDSRRVLYVQPAVGHYGVFNGSRFRADIAPRISDFIWTHDRAERRRPADAARPVAAKAPPVETAPEAPAEAVAKPARRRAPAKAATETPAPTPAPEPAMAETPVAAAPIVEAPVVETQALETPVLETPVVAAPEPVIDAPAGAEPVSVEPAAAPAPGADTTIAEPVAAAPEATIDADAAAAGEAATAAEPDPAPAKPKRGRSTTTAEVVTPPTASVASPRGRDRARGAVKAESTARRAGTAKAGAAAPAPRKRVDDKAAPSPSRSPARQPVKAAPAPVSPSAAPAEAKSPKASKAKPVATKPVATKTVAAKPVAAEPVAAKPVAAEPKAKLPAPAKSDRRSTTSEPAPRTGALSPRASLKAAGSASDDLSKIKGVGPSIARALRELGLVRFADIAALDAAGIARVEERIGFPGRIERDGWIAQAKALAER
ncbi:polyhydroxyalkanoate depolymerase [Segnochrobactrum spirostomi]|uniref:polyhydroxyalkanoate depolymerase n=1 Tax=Segnochrobactrum spirostomi TaxID=2608987 RepID=UPI0028B0E554|nr:polyhydroxyalkanoate depolymerase [Segnochrobactrum spirostomi]